MANLLESMLAGGQVKRQDKKHLTIIKRPLPIRPRQLLELFGAMGSTATFQAMMRGLDYTGADPHQMVFAALGRWPTLEEIAAFEQPYEPGPHLLALVRSHEFRAHLARRACEAFPERRRLLFVQIARSGGQRVLAILDGRHPLLPLDLTAKRFDDKVVLIQTLGHIFARTASTNTLAMAHPRMTAFLDQRSGVAEAGDGLAWDAVSPPCRVEDTLFAVLREPQARALGQVNALLAAWHAGERDVPAAIGTRMGRRRTVEDWRQIGREILGETVQADPLCHALGDGTAEGALLACSRSPVKLVQLEHLNGWARTELENMGSSEDDVDAEPILREQDLRAGDVEVLAAATAQDRVFYERFLRRVKETGLPAARGREL